MVLFSLVLVVTPILDYRKNFFPKCNQDYEIITRMELDLNSVRREVTGLMIE